jgi:hypothetical protein
MHTSKSTLVNLIDIFEACNNVVLNAECDFDFVFAAFLQSERTIFELIQNFLFLESAKHNIAPFKKDNKYLEKKFFMFTKSQLMSSERDSRIRVVGGGVVVITGSVFANHTHFHNDNSARIILSCLRQNK